MGHPAVAEAAVVAIPTKTFHSCSHLNINHFPPIVCLNFILSAEIENLAMGHPAVAEAAVVAIPNVKWGERPLLVVDLKPGAAEGAATQAVKEQLYK